MFTSLQISKATGFFDGLYAGAELDAKSFQVYMYL